MTDETTVEAVAKDIAARLGIIRTWEYTAPEITQPWVDATRAALAAIPEPATVGGVTREEVLAVITGSSVWHFHPDYGNGIFTTDADELADAILALFPPAPSTVGTVEDERQDWLNEVTGMMNADLWDDDVDQYEIIRMFVKHYHLVPYQSIPATPATTRDVGAEEVWDECIRAVEWAQQNGTDPLAYVYANNPYRAASAKGENS